MICHCSKFLYLQLDLDRTGSGLPLLVPVPNMPPARPSSLFLGETPHLLLENSDMSANQHDDNNAKQMRRKKKKRAADHGVKKFKGKYPLFFKHYRLSETC